MIDHCVAALKRQNEDKAYRIYITEALRALARMNVRYIDVINPKPEETRSSEEIILGIKEGLKKV